jgi:hypothetical protein
MSLLTQIAKYGSTGYNNEPNNSKFKALKNKKPAKANKKAKSQNNVANSTSFSKLLITEIKPLQKTILTLDVGYTSFS